VVRFTIDRQGNVLSSALEESSGHDTLDQAAVELPRRASPLPPPPSAVARDRMELVVPVRFAIRR
jgi:protein TonB